MKRLWLAMVLCLAIALAFLSAWAPPASAFGLSQQEIGLADNIRFEHLTMQQGLPASRVYCLLQDRMGYLWFGTEDGLARYDGYNFTVFRSDPNNPNSLSDGTILALKEDRNGRLWIGTQQGGLNRYDRYSGKFIHYGNETGNPFSLSDNTVQAIEEDNLGRIWVGTLSGLNLFIEEGATFQRYRKDLTSGRGISNEQVNALAADGLGGLWVGTADGLDYLDPENNVFVHYRYNREDSTSLGNNQVTALWLNADGVLWIGTAQGLERFDPRLQRFAHYRHDTTRTDSLGNGSVIAIRGDSQGVLWIGTQQGGLSRFLSYTGEFVRSSNQPDDPYSLSSNMVFAILEDRSGMVWVATDKGVSKNDPLTLSFPHYRHITNDAQSLLGNNVQAIYQDRTETLWIGTDHGLDRLNRSSTQFIHYQHAEYDLNSLSPGSVTSILQDRNGYLWIGTNGSGLDRLDISSGQFTHFREEPGSIFGPDTDEIRVIFEDRDGNLWIGTNGAGVKRLDRETGQFIHYGFVEAEANTVVSIFQDRRGLLWFGTYAGLGKFNAANGQLEVVELGGENVSRLRGYKVYAMHQDEDGLIWMGTLGGGLLRFDPISQTLSSYAGQEQLADNAIYSILETEPGLLWLSSNKGLIQLSYYSGSINTFDVNDGLQGNEFNPGAAFQGKDGRLYFGGPYGYNAFNPLEISGNSYVPPVVITSLTQNGVPVQAEGEPDLLQEIVLRWPGNYFEFEYAALNFRQADENQYSYWLEGFDEQYNEVGTRRYGQYTNLPGGSYTLHIRGSNNDGVWNENGTKLIITVIPPWWEMDWFRVGVPLLLVLLGVGGYFLRWRGIQRRNRQLALEVEERTHEIEQRRQVAEGLREVLVRLNSDLPLEETLEFIAAQANHLTGSFRVILFELNAERVPHLLVYVENVVGGFPGLKDEISGEKTSTLLKWLTGLLKPNAPVILRDLPNLPRQRKPPAHALLQSVHSLALVPVLAGERLYGGMAVMFPARRLTPEDISVLTSLADQAALAVENDDLRLKAEQLAVVSERARLARDLHDAVSQTLFSASLVAEALPAILRQDEQEGLQLLGELRQLNRGALAEMRSLLLELRPSSVVEVRLSDLLNQLAESVTGRTGHVVNLDLHEGVRLPEDVHICFYRIAQETLTNIVKHAQASEIRLSLNYSIPEEGPKTACVCLEICDNGRGFDLANVPPDHFGLRNMSERAAAVGAKLEVSSQPGQGTRMRIEWTGMVKGE